MKVPSAFLSPVFDDPEMTRQARLLHAVMLLTISFGIGFGLIILILLPASVLRAIIVMTAFPVGSVLPFVFMYRGRVRIASILFVTTFLIVIIALVVTAGGTSSPSFIALLLIVLSAGLLLGVRAGMVAGLLCIAAEIAIVYAETHSLLPPSMVQQTTSGLLIAHTFFFAWVVVVVFLYTNSIESALKVANQELAERTRVGEENRKTLQALAERVKEMTAVHRTAQLFQRDDQDLTTIFRTLASVLPSAFQYPEITTARVRCGGVKVSSPGFEGSFPSLRSEFQTRDGQQGAVEVAYTAEPPQDNVEPFLREEQELLNTVADMLRIAIDRRKGEENLRESEERFRTLIEKAPSAICISRDGITVYVNRQYLEMYGFENAEDAIGESIGERWSSESRGIIEKRARDRSRGLQVPADYQGMGLHRDGHLFPVEVAATIVELSDGPATLAFLSDVTERKNLEEQIRRTQRLDSIGSLAGGIAHDLNNVLAPILLSVDALEKKVPDQSSKNLVGIMRSSAKRGTDIVRQVLTFARGTEQERKPQHLRYLIKEIQSFVRESFPRNIELKSDLPKDIPLVLGDQTQLHQVLLNFCVNARDAMPDGGSITISVSTTRLGKQDLEGRSGILPGDFVVLSVTDTGSGIPPEIQKKIFEPFFTTKEVGKGTGLGLSTVFSIVRDHKGFIELKSELGKGTEFRVNLPALPSKVVEAAEEKEKVISRGNGERILIVEDEQSLLQITRETLQAYGYEVYTAVDGAEAEDLFKNEPRGSISLVFTDIDMPRMSGFDMAKRVLAYDPGVKILITSGTSSETGVEIAKARAEAFLPKPYTMEQLLQTIQGLLQGKSGVH